MAEKRFYWLKLKEDYFSDPKIKKLRKIAGGDTFTIIYLKMQLLSISQKGVLIYEGIEPTFEEELALKLDEDVENVQMTLAFLSSQGLIETDRNEFLLVDACKNIGSECESAERVRAFRERLNSTKALPCNASVTEVLRSSISISNSNNINNNIIEKKKEKKERKKEDYDEILDSKIESEEVKNAVLEFIKMRNMIKKPMTARALELMVGKLHKMADTPEKAVKILEQSIVHNWQDIYELKEDKNKKEIKHNVEGYNGEYAEFI